MSNFKKLIDNNLTGSLIYKALFEFKEKYAWDKSLTSPNTISTTAQSPDIHSATYLEDFINAQNKLSQLPDR